MSLIDAYAPLNPGVAISDPVRVRARVGERSCAVSGAVLAHRVQPTGVSDVHELLPDYKAGLRSGFLALAHRASVSVGVSQVNVTVAEHARSSARHYYL